MKTKVYPLLRLSATFLLVLLSYWVFSQVQTITLQNSSLRQGFNVLDSKSNKIEIHYAVNEFFLEDFVVNGERMKSVLLPGVFLPNDEGAPNVAGESRYVAIPQGATPVLNIKSMQVQKFENVEVGPAPRLPLESEVGPLHYEKNPAIYNKNAYYPEQPVRLSEPMQIRGVDVVLVGVTPFQYNPVTKELLVYQNIELEVNFEGGNGHFGSDAYRNPYFDAILSDNLLNYSSLPKIDYAARYASYYGATDNDECEYIIISPDGPDFQRWADSIRKFRTEQGILTKVFTLSQIGGNTTTAIENFINNAYNNWTIKPITCLLLGDYGTDPNNSIISPIYNNYCVSDNIYADVNNDMMPDVVVSRMTARNNTELQVMITKFLNYERNPPTDTSFYNRPITALGWQTERWFQICSESIGGFFRHKLGKSPRRQNAIYQGNPNVDPWSTATNTATVVNYFGPNGQGYIPATPQQLGGWTGGTATGINNAINSGAFILQHRDHGMETGWGEPSYTNSNINGLYNTNLTFVMSINCLTGKYNWSSECFTEKFHRYTKNGVNSGALGLLAASETSYSFVNDSYVWGVYDNWWPEFMPTYGSTPEPRGILPSFGNAAGKYHLQQSTWPYNTNNKAVTYNLFHHHGECYSVIYSEMPQQLTVAHDDLIYQGAVSFTVTATPGAIVALTVDNQIIGVQTAGTAPLVFNLPALVNGQKVIVTATKQNYFRYRKEVPVTIDQLLANFTANVTAGCEGLTVNFQDLSTGQPTSWEWTFEGATPSTSTEQNPTGIQYPAAGSYTVTLTVGKNGEFNTLSLTNFINTFTAPEAPVAENKSACYATPVPDLTAEGENVKWYADSSLTQLLGTGNTFATGQTAIGTYTYYATQMNGACEGPATPVTLTISDYPYVTLTPFENTCLNSPAFELTQGSPAGGSWMGNGVENNIFNPSLAGVGEHQLAYTYTNEYGCATTVAQPIIVNALPEVSLAALSPICDNGQPITLSGGMPEGGVYSGVGVENGIFTPSVAGDIEIAYSVTDPTTQCANTATQILTVMPSPVITFGGDTAICHNHVLTLDATNAGATYNWSTGETTPTVTVDITGTQIGGTKDVSVTVTGSNGCVKTGQITITFNDCTGIDELSAQLGVNIIPNPNDGNFLLELSSIKPMNVDVKVVNVFGKSIFTQKGLRVEGKIQSSLHLANIADGVYFLLLDANGQTLSYRLVIKK
ncbi:MAG: C25 family cysteine peptidase [Bacteroidales bacterium]